MRHNGFGTHTCSSSAYELKSGCTSTVDASSFSSSRYDRQYFYRVHL
jgi:hypothetical protein